MMRFVKSVPRQYTKPSEKEGQVHDMSRMTEHQIAVIDMMIEEGELKTLKQCLDQVLYMCEWERAIPKEIIEYLAKEAGVA